MRASSVAEALRHGRALLSGAGVDSPALDARLLLAHASGLSREDLIRSPERRIDAEPYERLLARRAGREPLALIVGWTEFWSLRLQVSSATLIPRPDSETLIEAALALRRDVDCVLDLGTGTGCLLLAALHAFKSAWGVGTDRSPAAAQLAATNASALGLADRALIVCADWAAPIAGRFDLVLSNPPYIASADILGLMPEVARFEPVSALDGGPDGLDAYRVLLGALPLLLRPGGAGIFELGAGQAGPVAELARQAGFGRVTTRADLAGIERALIVSG